MAADWNLIAAAFFASLPICATPGPNNIICAAIGARHGYRRALPYSLGATLGFPLLLGAVGLGLGGVLRLYPGIQLATQVLGALFLVYLAYRIATAPPVDVEHARVERVYGFRYAMVFQWVNPKAVSFAFSLISLYARPQALLIDVPLLMLMSAIITLPVTMIWAIAGNVLGKLLHTPLRQRVFNGVMAALLLSAALGILLYRV